MTAAIPGLSHRVCALLAAISIGAGSVFVAAPAQSRGPDGIADVAEKVIDAVVNISTSQTVEAVTTLVRDLSAGVRSVMKAKAA